MKQEIDRLSGIRLLAPQREQARVRLEDRWRTVPEAARDEHRLEEAIMKPVLDAIRVEHPRRRVDPQDATAMQTTVSPASHEP